MICPYCKNFYSPKKVLRTWITKEGIVKRKRKCERCGHKFHTIEMVIVTKDRILYELHNKAKSMF